MGDRSQRQISRQSIRVKRGLQRQIPKAYLEADWSNKTDSKLVDDKDNSVLGGVLYIVLTLLAYGVGLGFVIMMLMLSLGPDKSGSWMVTGTVLMIVGGILIFMFGPIAANKLSDAVGAWDVTRKARKRVLIDAAKQEQNHLPKLPELVSDLIQNGRKTIATIVEIEYIPVTEALNIHQALVTQERPRFKVKYKFNPPDDAMGDKDQIHYCTVFTEPERIYRVGDPIPILYNYHGHHTIDEIVRSMVFPAPLEYICERFVVCQMKHCIPELTTLIDKYHQNWPYGFPLMDQLLEQRSELTVLDLILKRTIDDPSMVEGNPFACTYLLELLSIFIRTKDYKSIHADCLRLMFICFEQSDELMRKIYHYIMGYLNLMCVPGNIVAPDAFAVLREYHHIDMMGYKGDRRLINEISRISKEIGLSTFYC